MSQHSFAEVLSPPVSGEGPPATLKGAEGYTLRLSGILLSIGPDTYDLSSGPANLLISGLEGIEDEGTIVVLFVPSATEATNISIPLAGVMAAGEGMPVTFTVNTGADQELAGGLKVNVWGELV